MKVHFEHQECRGGPHRVDRFMGVVPVNVVYRDRVIGGGTSQNCSKGGNREEFRTDGGYANLAADGRIDCGTVVCYLPGVPSLRAPVPC